MRLMRAAVREPSKVQRNYRKSEAHKHKEKGKFFYITLPKLPFPMARNIWKWSKVTAKGGEKGKREKENHVFLRDLFILFAV